MSVLRHAVLFLLWPFLAVLLLALQAIVLVGFWLMLPLGGLYRDGDAPEPLWRWHWRRD